MSENRKKNSLRNIVWGLLNKIINLLLPFVTRTVTLYLLGANYLGVGTLFSSVLSFLSLTELGLSSAIVYIMYKPVAEGDTVQIGAILNYYKKLYWIIGCVMLGIGTLIVPVIPYLMRSGVPDDINIYILYYIYLINSSLSYFFAGYRSSLLSAHQREDVSTKILTGVNIIVQFVQILTLFITRNFYIYAFVPIGGTLITNVAYAKVTCKMFPNIIPRGKVKEAVKCDIKAKLSGLVGTKLNSIVVHSADTMVISAFLGLVKTAQYGNYYLVFNAVCGFVAVIYNSLTASIGNKLVTDTLEKNYQFFKCLSFFNTWIVCWCSTCFLCLFEPFMNVWVGEQLALGLPFTILMVIYFFIYQIQKTVLTFKDAAGLWQVDKLRPYVSMLVNIVSNLILVQIIGIYGIVLSTILAFMISLPWANKILFDNLFKKNHIVNLIMFLRDFVITAMISIITYLACMICNNGIIGIVERLAICCVLPNLLLYAIFYKSNEFLYWKRFLIRAIKKRG
jgi:O-antigen/teichoic acid export membrane protein